MNVIGQNLEKNCQKSCLDLFPEEMQQVLSARLKLVGGNLF